MRESLGTISFRNSSCFPVISGARVDNPVMFPPGRARRSTNPLPTGSVSCPITIGIVEVASLAARVDDGPDVTMISTLRRTSSAASAGRPSGFPSAYRHSMTIFFSSTYPSSRSSRRNASMRAGLVVGELAPRYPIRGIFVGCCASARKQSAKRMAQRVRTVIFFFMWFSLSRSTCHSTLDTRPFSLDHLIRPHQYIGRNGQADLFGSFQVDDELKLRRLLHWEISWLCPFQDLIHVSSGATEQVGSVSAIVHETAGFRIFRLWINRREPALYREVCNLCSL